MTQFFQLWARDLLIIHQVNMVKLESNFCIVSAFTACLSNQNGRDSFFSLQFKGCPNVLCIGTNKRIVLVECVITLCLNRYALIRPVRWRCGNDIAMCAGGLGLIPGPVKSDTVPSTVRYRYDVCLELHCPGAEPRRLTSPLVTRFVVIIRV